MKYRIEKKGKRWALYLHSHKTGWFLHQTYMTSRGAEMAAQIMYEQI